MKNPLPPVPARTDPELRAFLESVRSAVKTILERGNLNAGDLKDAGIITAEQADRLKGLPALISFPVVRNPMRDFLLLN